MLVEQYQRTVNLLDKEIADLEKKKAEADGKSASAQNRAASVYISKTASASMVNSKLRQIDRYKNDSIKAQKISADLQKKIADKRKKEMRHTLDFKKNNKMNKSDRI